MKSCEVYELSGPVLDLITDKVREPRIGDRLLQWHTTRNLTATVIDVDNNSLTFSIIID